jgi:localization factor PodJL
LIVVGACFLLAGAYQLTQNLTPDDAGVMTASRQITSPEPKGAMQTAVVVRPSSSQQSADPSKSTQQMAAAAPRVDPAPVGAIGAPGQSSVTASINSAMALATLAANGDASAQFELASRYADGRDIARDAKLAVLWFEKAAQQGLAPAQYRLGTLYEKGVGVERNETVAHDWYQRSAEAGNVRAMHNLAVMLAEGAGGKPDYAAASVWFRKAADLGVRDSQYNLAILYARGMGVEPSLVQSYLWFSAAAAQGDADAAKKRDEVAARLGARDLETAKALAAGFQAKTPAPAANEVAAPPGGWRAPAPASKASGKPKVSWFQSFWDAAKAGAAQSDFQTRL